LLVGIAPSGIGMIVWFSSFLFFFKHFRAEEVNWPANGASSNMSDETSPLLMETINEEG
jgi:hypothetical protein